MLDKNTLLFLVIAVLIFMMRNKTTENMEETSSHKNYALVLVNPVNDYLHEKGVAYNAFSESLFNNRTIQNLTNIIKYCNDRDINIFVSKRSLKESDLDWKFGGYIEDYMLKNRMFMSEFGSSIYDSLSTDLSNAIVCEDFKLYGPTNDLILQLRKRGIKKVYLAGMAANLELDSHMRSLIENGFEVIVIKDATAGSKIDLGDGYLAGLTNFGYIASDTISTVKFLEYFPKQNSIYI